MKSAAQLEKDILSLPPAERAHLALTAWESLEADPAFAADRLLDPEGVAIALQRNRQIDSGLVTPLTHVEFIQRTGGTKK